MKTEGLVMFCKKCGNPIPEGSAYCEKCGASQGDTVMPAAVFDGMDQNDINANKGISCVSYLGILFFIPLLVRPDSKYCRFHVNQGLILLLFNIVVNAARGIIDQVLKVILRSVLHLGFIYSIVSPILTTAIGAVCLILFIYGLYNSLSGKAVKLPVIGGFNLIK